MMISYSVFLTLILIVGILLFIMDFFCKFLVDVIIMKRLPKEIEKMDHSKLTRRYKDSERFVGTYGYVTVFFFTGLFVFSYMRIPKAKYRCYEEAMTKRGLSK